MSRNAFGLFVVAVGLTAAAVLTTTGVPAAPVPLNTAGGEWPAYGGNDWNQHYSALDQVNAQNFSKMEVAWRFRTDSLGPRPEFKLEGTPLMAKGMVYATGGTRRSVVALDGSTGELKWVHSEDEGKRAAESPRQLSGRGLSYWTDGKEERILYVTIGYQLVALDAKTGNKVQAFGKGGLVDLKEGVYFGNRQPIDPVTGEIGLHATPVVAGDTVVVGAAFDEGNTPKTHNNTKGQVRGFDVRSGKKLWTFNTIPRPGEFGNDTWENDSWSVNGNTGVWNQIAIDEELGMAYLPVESPTSDFYGGQRPGNNLFAESIVAVDLKTGVRKWHFQLVHHPIWDTDISSGPILMDLNVDGKPVKAIAVMAKTAQVYTFDRATGKPVWPIEERPVPQSDTPGEKTSPTQPFPTKPPPYDYQGVTPDVLIDFTPELHAQALENAKRLKLGPIFTPAPVSKLEGPIHGFRSSGGTNVFGGGFDPETHILYVPSYTSLAPVALMKPPSKDFSDMDYVQGNVISGIRGVPGAGGGGGRGRGGDTFNANPQGLSIVKPPYGRITAINMDRGEHVWQVPHGETPDNVRNHPALKGLNIPRTGQSGAVGLVITKSLVVAGEPQQTTMADGRKGAMLRAYDKATGKEVGAVYMPAPQSGTPSTYMLNGRQYIILAISGGQYVGEYVAFALPQADKAKTTSGQ
jgi:quinoprotein glucose dehydrogenase